MPEVIEALAGSGTPFSILTKGTLLRRDLPLLVEAAQAVPSTSPSPAPSTTRRCTAPSSRDALAGRPSRDRPGGRRPRLRRRGLRHAGRARLTDSAEHLDRALAAIAESGASFVGHTALHLRPGAREWFLAWLAREHPELVPRYERLYRGGSYVARPYRDWLADRFREAVARHGLDRRRTTPRPLAARFATRGTWRPEPGAGVRGARWCGGRLRTGAGPEPTLF